MAIVPRLSQIVVNAIGHDPTQGRLVADSLTARCAVGRGGLAKRKREGDGATPIGAHRLVALLYRPDRVRRPVTALPIAPLKPNSGWCDDPGDHRYNRPIRLPYPGRHEKLWRKDNLYDLLVILDYNLDRPRPGAGSAIFLHLAAPDFAPTAGCIAVTETTMRRLLARSRPGTVISVA
ncbi:L,D-transpeptidase family protein [Bauldia sp.]|uniref:L,D-transpeptidase family protein n=1 Tax=Bauldia sp. TaxID=2575872 RepID=UPI003BA982B5